MDPNEPTTVVVAHVTAWKIPPLRRSYPMNLKLLKPAKIHRCLEKWVCFPAWWVLITAHLLTSPKPPRAKVPGLTRLLRAAPPWFVRMAQLKRTCFFWFPRKPLMKGCFHTWKREDLGWCRIFKWILGGPLPFWGSPCWFYYSSFYDTKKSVFGKRFLGSQNDRHKLSTGSFLVASSSLGVWDFNVGRRLALSFFFLKELSDEEKSDVFLPVSIN